MTVPDDLDITVQNIVMTVEFGHELNLNAIAVGLGLEQVEYEPKQFPGVIYRPGDHPIAILLFGSGRAVITGATHLNDAEEAVPNVSAALDELGLLE